MKPVFCWPPGASWGPLGAPSGDKKKLKTRQFWFCRVLGALGALLGRLRALLGRLGVILGLFWPSSAGLVCLSVFSSCLSCLSCLVWVWVWSGLLRVSVWPLVAVLGRLVFFSPFGPSWVFLSFLGLVSDPRQGPFRFVKQNVFGNFRVCPNVCLMPCMRRVFARPLATSSPTAT